jgi:hypothetical protein
VIVDQAHDAATASEELTRKNADEIHAAPGADQRLDPALNDAGRLGMCRRPSYRRTAGACSSLVPPSLREAVVGVELPSRTASAGDVWSALDGQTGKLDTANANGTASLEIVEACEKRDAATFNHVTRKWWQLWR